MKKVSSIFLMAVLVMHGRMYAPPREGIGTSEISLKEHMTDLMQQKDQADAAREKTLQQAQQQYADTYKSMHDLDRQKSQQQALQQNAKPNKADKYQETINSITEQQTAMENQLNSLQAQMNAIDKNAAASTDAIRRKVNNDMSQIAKDPSLLNQTISDYSADISATKSRSQRKSKLASFSRFVSKISQFFSRVQIKKFVSSIRSKFTNVKEVQKSFDTLSTQLQRTTQNITSIREEIAADIQEVKQELQQAEHETNSAETQALQAQLTVLQQHDQLEQNKAQDTQAAYKGLNQISSELTAQVSSPATPVAEQPAVAEPIVVPEPKSFQSMFAQEINPELETPVQQPTQEAAESIAEEVPAALQPNLPAEEPLPAAPEVPVQPAVESEESVSSFASALQSGKSGLRQTPKKRPQSTPDLLEQIRQRKQLKATEPNVKPKARTLSAQEQAVLGRRSAIAGSEEEQPEKSEEQEEASEVTAQLPQQAALPAAQTYQQKSTSPKARAVQLQIRQAQTAPQEGGNILNQIQQGITLKKPEVPLQQKTSESGSLKQILEQSPMLQRAAQAQASSATEETSEWEE